MPVQNAVTSHSEASTHKTEKKTKNSENVIAISKKQLQSIKMEKNYNNRADCGGKRTFYVFNGLCAFASLTANTKSLVEGITYLFYAQLAQHGFFH